jgi:hypothetical protein
MKKLIILLVIIGSTLSSNAQSTNEVGKIVLSVVMPNNVEGMNDSQLSKLETEITKIVTSTGLSASGYNNNFVIYPKFAINETSVVESGLQDITIIDCDLTLFIKQVDNNVIFSTISKSLKGNGKNKLIAITSALTKINTSDKDYQLFIEKGKTKILQYYESKCQDIIKKSESLVKIQNYEQALGLLMTVPEEVSCYNKVQEKSIEAYKAYQKQRCIIQIQEAKTQLAVNNYSSALNTLSQIDPSTPCFKESQTLVNNAASKVDAEDKKLWDFKMKTYTNSVALEKERINAVKDIAVSYYKSIPKSINYTYLVR